MSVEKGEVINCRVLGCISAAVCASNSEFALTVGMSAGNPDTLRLYKSCLLCVGRSRKEAVANKSENFQCCYQKESNAGILCQLATINRFRTSTKLTDEFACRKCDIGRIYREIKCKDVGGRVAIVEHRLSYGFERHVINTEGNIFCKKTKKATDLENCKQCTLVNAETTTSIKERTASLFYSLGFTEAVKHIDEAFNKINIEQDYYGAIREATVSLESTLTLILEKIGIEPTDKTVTGLYNEVKNNLKLGDEFSATHLKQVLGSSAGAVTGLGAMRNDLSDAHGKGLISPDLYESYAELALNLSATMSTFIIRRYKEAQTGN
jgi:Abortive infection C-terminus